MFQIEHKIAVLHDILEDTETSIEDLYQFGISTTYHHAIVALTKNKEKLVYKPLNGLYKIQSHVLLN